MDGMQTFACWNVCMNEFAFIRTCVLVSWNVPLGSASTLLMCHCWKLLELPFLLLLNAEPWSVYKR